MRIRFPFIALSAAVLLAMAICGWGAWKSSRRLWALAQKPEPIRVHTKQEYLEMASRIQSAVSDLNQSLSLFASDTDPVESNRFITTSLLFQSWIDSQQNNSKMLIRGTVAYNRDTAELLNDVRQSYRDYLLTAYRVLQSSNNITATSALLENNIPLQTQSSRLFDAASRLLAMAELPDLTTNDRNKEARMALLSVLALLGLLIFCGWLAVRFYRLEILPLHQRLDEHAAIIEKQRRLAHFGELAAGLAHEIRNPLTAINARLFTLQRSLLPNTPAHEDALVIRTEITRLDRVVRDFLKLARPADPATITITAEPMLREIVDLLGPGLQSKGIKLTLDLAESASFEGDPLQLKQVLINLVKNAGESIDQDGAITLRARTGKEKVKGRFIDVVIIEVEDTGPGISPEVQERLFEPFYSTKDGGTGLGLSISWQIVDKHGGMLDFQNKQNTGSLFRIVLPRLKED